MKKVFLTLALGLGLMLGGCGESPERVKRVQFFGSKQAIVQYRAAGADEPENFTLTCDGPDVETPFKYAWEIDCDLNTITVGLDGRLKVQEWDNPDDDEVEAQKGLRNLDYDDDDDDERQVDAGFDGGDMALGMLAGLALGSSTGTTKKVSTTKTTRKTTRTTTRTIKATPTKIKTSSSKRR